MPGHVRPIAYARLGERQMMPAWTTVVASIILAGSASPLLRGWRWAFWPALLNAGIVGCFYLVGAVLVPKFHDFEALLLVLFLSMYAGIVLLGVRVALAQRRALLAAGATQAAPAWLWRLIVGTLMLAGTLVIGCIVLVVLINTFMPGFSIFFNAK